MKRNILIVDQEHEFTVNLREELEKDIAKFLLPVKGLRPRK